MIRVPFSGSCGCGTRLVLVAKSIEPILDWPYISMSHFSGVRKTSSVFTNQMVLPPTRPCARPPARPASSQPASLPVSRPSVRPSVRPSIHCAESLSTSQMSSPRTGCAMLLLLWMVAKSIWHHLRKPGMIRFPCKYQQAMVSHDSFLGAGFIHPHHGRVALRIYQTWVQLGKCFEPRSVRTNRSEPQLPCFGPCFGLV